MATKISTEFLELLEIVADDGELSHGEIRKLGKWINANKSERQFWPVDLFLPLLKDVFADRNVSKAEARQVGHLIQSVRRDWARRRNSRAIPDAETLVAKSVANFDPTFPHLPMFDVTTTVDSHSAPDVDYSIDFNNPSCSCPDFRGSRQHLPAGDISRCCKHMMEAYARLRPAKGWPSWLDSFLEAGFRPYPDQKWDILEIDGNNILISSASPEWCNAYCKSNGDNLKFGYSVDDNRWAYGTAPEHSRTIKKAMKKLSGRFSFF